VQLTTDQKGAIAELEIARRAAELGIGVWHAYTVERYDLIFDLRPQLLRVQCKWVSRYGDVIVVRCYSLGGRAPASSDGRMRPRTLMPSPHTAQTFERATCFRVACFRRERSAYVSVRRRTINAPESRGQTISSSALH
jgi:hypothetical protein